MIHLSPASKKHTSSTKVDSTLDQRIEKIFQAKRFKMQPGADILILNKIGFNAKLIRRDGEDATYLSKQKSTKIM